MTTINLRDFYSWYSEDEFVEVSDEVAAELMADKRYQKSHEQRMRRNKSFYTLDLNDGIETAITTCCNKSPEMIYEIKENRCRLCHALNALPEIQGRRIEAHYLLGKSRKKIALEEGVSESSVNESIKRGLRQMRKFLTNFD